MPESLDEESQAKVLSILRDLLWQFGTGKIVATEYVLCSMIPGSLVLNWIPKEKPNA